MKTFASSFWDKVQDGGTTLATFWHVIRYDLAEFGWVEHPRDIVFDGVTYRSASGLSVSSTEDTEKLSVPTVDVTAFLDVTTEAEILAGIWDGSEITIFEGDYASMPPTFNWQRLHAIRYGRLGQIIIHDNVFRAELRGLVSRLETTVGRLTTSLCPWKFGSVECLGTGDGGAPTINMANFTFAGTVTSIGDNPRRRFSASGITPRIGSFSLGTIQFTSGYNSTMPPMDIRRWRDKEFMMQRPLPFDAAVGDTFTAVLGDNKTLRACRDVFNNVGQHAGWTYLPGIFKMLQNDATRRKREPQTSGADGNPANFTGGESDNDADGNAAEMMDPGE